jgi:hypothetical protein
LEREDWVESLGFRVQHMAHPAKSVVMFGALSNTRRPRRLARWAMHISRAPFLLRVLALLLPSHTAHVAKRHVVTREKHETNHTREKHETNHTTSVRMPQYLPPGVWPSRYKQRLWPSSREPARCESLRSFACESLRRFHVAKADGSMLRKHTTSELNLEP